MPENLEARAKNIARASAWQKQNAAYIQARRRAKRRGLPAPVMPPKHGDARRGSKTSMYTRWENIRKRCLNPTCRAFKDYGGRGIQLHGPWIESYGAFRDWIAANLGSCPEGFTLDRIDNNGHYEPGNLRWANWQTQVSNRRKAA